MPSSPIYDAWVATSQAAIVLERAVDAGLRPHGLSAYQGVALLVLAEHGPQRMSHLARFLLQQTQTTTDLVDRLERRGLVQRARHESDRRVVLVEITDQGRAIVGDIAGTMTSVGEQAFGGLSRAELTRMIPSMRRVRDSAAHVGGVPTDYLQYAEERLNISSALWNGGEAAAD